MSKKTFFDISKGILALIAPGDARLGRREGSRDASPQGVFPPHMSPEKRI